ncbi:uncharacterized protein LOC144001023 isoform X4 [Festucalex cinctus]
MSKGGLFDKDVSLFRSETSVRSSVRPRRVMTFDAILEEVGALGPFQVVLVVLMASSRLVLPCNFLLNNFVAAVPPHRCKVGRWNASAGDDDDDDPTTACEMLAETPSPLAGNRSEATPTTVQCLHGWVYDNSTFSSTIATEWDLVCERKHLSQTINIIFFLGVMLGSLVFGLLSDKRGVGDVTAQGLHVRDRQPVVVARQHAAGRLGLPLQRLAPSGGGGHGPAGLGRPHLAVGSRIGALAFGQRSGGKSARVPQQMRTRQQKTKVGFQRQTGGFVQRGKVKQEPKVDLASPLQDSRAQKDLVGQRNRLVRHGGDVLRHQLELGRLRPQRVPDAVRVRRHRDSRQAADLPPDRPRRPPAVPGRHAGADGNVRRRQHLCAQRHVAAAFGGGHFGQRPFGSLLHDHLPVHLRALPHRAQAERSGLHQRVESRGRVRGSPGSLPGGGVVRPPAGGLVRRRAHLRPAGAAAARDRPPQAARDHPGRGDARALFKRTRRNSSGDQEYNMMEK